MKKPEKNNISKKKETPDKYEEDEDYDPSWDEWYEDGELINKKYKINKINKRISKYRDSY